MTEREEKELEWYRQFFHTKFTPDSDLPKVGSMLLGHQWRAACVTPVCPEEDPHSAPLPELANECDRVVALNTRLTDALRWAMRQLEDTASGIPDDEVIDQEERILALLGEGT